MKVSNCHNNSIIEHVKGSNLSITFIEKYMVGKYEICEEMHATFATSRVSFLKFIDRAFFSVVSLAWFTH